MRTLWLSNSSMPCTFRTSFFALAHSTSCRCTCLINEAFSLIPGGAIYSSFTCLATAGASSARAASVAAVVLGEKVRREAEKEVGGRESVPG
jgi:hypothetical protein